MKCIIGLGNPGLRYQNTRHNLGFAVITEVAKMLHATSSQRKFRGLYASAQYQGESIALLQPLTYMNNSGISVAAIVNFFKIDLSDLLIIYDDMDFEVGQIRFRTKGSAGGHNGMKSIIKELGTNDFSRLRLGIGKPQGNQVDFVLSKFPKAERVIVDKAIESAAEGVLCFATEGIDRAMNKYNINIT